MVSLFHSIIHQYFTTNHRPPRHLKQASFKEKLSQCFSSFKETSFSSSRFKQQNLIPTMYQETQLKPKYYGKWIRLSLSVHITSHLPNSGPTLVHSVFYVCKNKAWQLKSSGGAPKSAITNFS